MNTFALFLMLSVVSHAYGADCFVQNRACLAQCQRMPPSQASIDCINECVGALQACPSGEAQQNAREEAMTPRTPSLRASVAAQECLHRARKSGGFNVADVSVRNTCSYRIEVRSTCVGGRGANRRVQRDYPSPGVYSFTDGGLFGIAAHTEQDDPAADVCESQGGRMRYAACSDGTPYFTAPDASQARCME